MSPLWDSTYPIFNVIIEPSLRLSQLTNMAHNFFDPPPTPILRSVLRLSRKYTVTYLYTRALMHLHSTFPTTIQAWRLRDTTRTIRPSTTPLRRAAIGSLVRVGVDRIERCVLNLFTSALDDTAMCRLRTDE
ncbi:hypothetical protein BDQ17DRAFT_1420430 [Cyathus striatus]|nr:hypothetical protein BDQ17DRAFT_1420430 [Cyathus striatus]